MLQPTDIQNIGVLDRRITLLKPVQTRNALGEVVETFVAEATVWAQVEWQRAGSGEREAKEHSKELQQAALVFTIRYRDDVNESWRAVFEGRTYDIERIAQDGRKRFQKIVAVWRN